MLLSYTQGAPIFWGIGNIQKQTYDEHPAILVRVERDAEDDMGRIGTVIVCIVQRTRLDGTKYLSEARLLEKFVYPRDEVVEGFDGVPLPQLVAKLSDQRREFVQRGTGVEVGEPATEGEAAEAAATVSDDLPF